MSKDVPRGPKGHRRYAMDYVGNKKLYAAVMWARRMIREGKAPGIAITRAARYHDLAVGDVAHYVGQAGGTYAHRRPAAEKEQKEPAHEPFPNSDLPPPEFYEPDYGQSDPTDETE